MNRKAMMAIKAATPTAIATSLTTWLRGAFMVQAWVASAPWRWLTKARNSAVLLEVSASSWSRIAGTLAGYAGQQPSFPKLSGIPTPGPVRPRGQDVGPAHQPGEHDHAPGADHEGLGADPLDHLLEVADIGGPDVQQGVRLPGDRGRPGHLRVPAHRGPDVRG